MTLTLFNKLIVRNHSFAHLLSSCPICSCLPDEGVWFCGFFPLFHPSQKKFPSIQIELFPNSINFNYIGHRSINGTGDTVKNTEDENLSKRMIGWCLILFYRFKFRRLLWVLTHLTPLFLLLAPSMLLASSL